MAQAGSNYEKNGGPKSRWTVLLSQADPGQHFGFLNPDLPSRCGFRLRRQKSDQMTGRLREMYPSDETARRNQSWSCSDDFCKVICSGVFLFQISFVYKKIMGFLLEGKSQMHALDPSFKACEPK